MPGFRQSTSLCESSQQVIQNKPILHSKWIPPAGRHNGLTLDSITIRQDPEGRFCLNDLHKAAGERKADQPSSFLILQKTMALVKELLDDHSQNSGNGPINTIHGGTRPGTYVCKELVYAYAMWISPAFHLKVIRAYDRLATQGVAAHENAAEDLLKNRLKYLEAVMGQAREPRQGHRNALQRVARGEAIPTHSGGIRDAQNAPHNRRPIDAMKALRGNGYGCFKGDFCDKPRQ